MEIPKFIMGAIEKMQGNDGEKETIFGHYGMKEEEFDMWVKRFMVEIINADSKAQVIDEFFKKSDEETRIKIYAYAVAQVKLYKLKIIE